MSARAGVMRLNRQYGPAPAGPRFLLLHRRRTWNAAQGVWMGWERKRGKLHELNRLLRGATDTSFVATGTGPPACPSGVRYVITLDADTRVPRDAVRRLVGKMAHPLNAPRFDARSGRVFEGYAVLQPRIAPSLPIGREGSAYQRLVSSANGMVTPVPSTGRISILHKIPLQPLSRGRSPLIRNRFCGGGLIGIVSLGLATVGRYSLAIPIELYLERRRELEGEPDAARPQHAWIGFYPQGYDGGVVVTGVVPDGPSDRAGLKRGDLVLSVDGAPVSNLRELYGQIWKKRPGDVVGLQILRESSILIPEVAAGDRREFYR